MLHHLREQAKGAKLKFLQCMSPEVARFDRSLRRRKTSGVEGEAEVDVACSKRRN
jgi:hypothetical protein